MKLSSHILGLASAIMLGTALPSAVSAENRVIEISSPNMRVYLPDTAKATGRAVVALPGGGYSHLALNHEGHDWAPFFNERGIAYAVVAYTMPKGDRSLPIGDACNAVKLLRDSAGVWNLDPAQIGIMGSSAGGHLASTVATHAPAESRPDFRILFYPVITMDKAYTHRGSRDNLLGKDADETLETEYSNEKQVTAETPRAFLILSSDDRAVPRPTPSTTTPPSRPTASPPPSTSTPPAATDGASETPSATTTGARRTQRPGSKASDPQASLPRSHTMPATPPTGGFRLMAAPLQGYTEAPFRHFHAEIYGGGKSLTYFSPFLRIEKGSVRPRDLRDITSPLNANHRLIPGSSSATPPNSAP